VSYLNLGQIDEAEKDASEVLRVLALYHSRVISWLLLNALSNRFHTHPGPYLLYQVLQHDPKNMQAKATLEMALKLKERDEYIKVIEGNPLEIQWFVVHKLTLTDLQEAVATLKARGQVVWSMLLKAGLVNKHHVYSCDVNYDGIIL